MKQEDDRTHRGTVHQRAKGETLRHDSAPSESRVNHHRSSLNRVNRIGRYRLPSAAKSVISSPELSTLLQHSDANQQASYLDNPVSVRRPHPTYGVGTNRERLP